MASAFYRTGFIAADERAKSMQRYFEKVVEVGISDKDLYNLSIQGTSFLSSILRGTDYYTRLEKIGELEERRKQEGNPIDKRAIATKIFKIQQEYADMAGIFGRPAIKGIERREGQESTIKETIEREQEDEEDEEELSEDV